jgi:hypothetical protein
MVLNVSAMSVEDAAQLIAQVAKLPCYQPTGESLMKIRDQALAAEVKASLFDFPMAGVHASEQKVYINVKAPEEQSAAIRVRIEEAVAGIEDLVGFEIRVDPFY